jgi:hypothetical protein
MFPDKVNKKRDSVYLPNRPAALFACPPSASTQILSKTISNASPGNSCGFTINKEGFQPSECVIIHAGIIKSYLGFGFNMDLAHSGFRSLG